jgi:hypothetical protein
MYKMKIAEVFFKKVLTASGIPIQPFRLRPPQNGAIASL